MKEIRSIPLWLGAHMEIKTPSLTYLRACLENKDVQILSTHPAKHPNPNFNRKEGGIERKLESNLIYVNGWSRLQGHNLYFKQNFPAYFLSFYICIFLHMMKTFDSSMLNIDFFRLEMVHWHPSYDSQLSTSFIPTSFQFSRGHFFAFMK